MAAPRKTPRTTRPRAAPDEQRVQKALANAQAHCAAQHAQFTELRATVFELLLRRDAAAKAYDLLADMQARQPGVAPMTVYRALDFLVEHGLVHKVASNSSFLVCQQADHHHHHEDPVFLVCERCGTTTEWHDPAVGRQLAQALSATGFHAHGMEIQGECARCAGEKVAD